MQISFDTEKEDVDSLKNILKLLQETIVKKGGSIEAIQNNIDLQKSEQQRLEQQKQEQLKKAAKEYTGSGRIVEYDKSAEQTLSAILSSSKLSRKI